MRTAEGIVIEANVYGTLMFTLRQIGGELDGEHVRYFWDHRHVPPANGNGPRLAIQAGALLGRKVRVHYEADGVRYAHKIEEIEP